MLLYTARQHRTRSPRSDKLRPNIPVVCSDNSIKTRARTHGFITPLSAIIDAINNTYPNKEVVITRVKNVINISTVFSLDETERLMDKQHCIFTCSNPSDELKWTATFTESINDGVKFYISTRPITYCDVKPFSLRELLNVSHAAWIVKINHTVLNP